MKRILSSIIILTFVMAASTGCAASGGYSSAAAETEEYAASSAASDYAPPQADEYLLPEAEFSGEAGQQSTTPLPLLTPSNAQGKKMVYSVSLWLQTTTFPEGTRRLINVVGDLGGYVQSAFVEGRSLYTPDTARYARYTFRIPSERLAEFLTTMEDNYNLLRLEQESQEITAQHQQNSASLSDLRDQEQRLLTLLEAEMDEPTRQSLERELADVQASIAALDATKTSMDNAVLYSTVAVQLEEVVLDDGGEVPPEDSFSVKLDRTTRGSVDNFVSFWQDLLLFLITALPVIIVLGLLAVVVFLVWRLWRKKGGAVRKALGVRKKTPAENILPEEIPSGDDNTEQ